MAALPARQPACSLVRGPSERSGWPHPADRHCGPGAQAAGRLVALPGTGPGAGRCGTEASVRGKARHPRRPRRVRGGSDRYQPWLKQAGVRDGSCLPGAHPSHGALWSGTREGRPDMRWCGLTHADERALRRKQHATTRDATTTATKEVLTEKALASSGLI